MSIEDLIQKHMRFVPLEEGGGKRLIPDINSLIGAPNKAFRQMIDAFADRISELKPQPDCYIAKERGSLVAAPLKYLHDKPMFFARRPARLLGEVVNEEVQGGEGGIMQMQKDLVEKTIGDLNLGRKPYTFIVDDWMESADNLQAVIRLSRRLGLEVIGVGIVLEVLVKNQSIGRDSLIADGIADENIISMDRYDLPEPYASIEASRIERRKSSGISLERGSSGGRALRYQTFENRLYRSPDAVVHKVAGGTRRLTVMRNNNG